uniref:Cyclase/dehydrase n=1 Tax=Zea mays TaxID=4577 RepID=B6T2Z5_MAIZE|nr:cyclase/dehydrase [Zea mays]|eukprot:NP_001148441.1 cyclase/dehydrase [Zea mays]
MAAGAALYYYHPGAGKVSLEAVAPSSPSLALRPSQSKVLCVSSSRWWMRRRWEGKASSVSSRARASARPALFSPVAMDWQECTTELEVDVPCSVAYQCYSERESIPQWMPFISSVKILEDKPDLSRWTLKYEVLGRDVEFSWLARNMTPIKNQKIHWRSLEGLANRGAVRFFPKSSSSCRVQLTVAYEVPEILAPVASALKPFLESLLLKGLERFATFAKERNSKIPQA